MQQHCCKWLLGCLSAGVVAVSCSLVSAQTFDLSLSAPSSVEGTAGSMVQVEVVGRLASAGIATPDGAQAWSVSVATDGWSPVAATTAGTAGALDTEGGLRDSDGEGSFEKTELINPAENGGQEGVVSAVVLSFGEVVTLPPSGSADILRITCEATVPPLSDGACDPLVGTAEFVDELTGSGEPVVTTVTYRGGSFDPVLGSVETLICPTLPAGETALLARPDGGVETGPAAGGARPFRVDIPGPQATTNLQFGVYLDSQIEPCATEDPAECDAAENFLATDPFGARIFGCADMVDNDSDGLTDAADPDCRGVQGWSMSVKVDECIMLQAATTRGTIGDLDVRPPGIRDSEGGNFEKTEVVNPDRDAGMRGVVSAVVLSFTNPVILPQVGESLVLIVVGTVDTSGLANPGDCTDACSVRILSPVDDGLVGSGEPVKTAVTVAGETSNPTVTGADIRICIEQVQVDQFARCDPNNDGRQNIADAVWLINELFYDGAETTCQDAGDCNDDGLGPDSSDAVYAISYQFMGGSAPPPPFPGCGGDPTEDLISCDVIPAACQ